MQIHWKINDIRLLMQMEVIGQTQTAGCRTQFHPLGAIFEPFESIFELRGCVRMLWDSRREQNQYIEFCLLKWRESMLLLLLLF